MADEQVPLATEAGEAIFGDFDTWFSRGLQAIIIGVATWLGTESGR